MSTLLIADVGNTRIKLGRFDQFAGGPSVQNENSPSLPEPIASCALPLADCDNWLDMVREFVGTELPRVVVASVNAPAAARFTTVIDQLAADRGESWQFKLLTHHQVPLAMHVDEPQRVGIDRLCGALAADRLRRPERSAIVVDIGTAIKVDLVTADGAFQGGAILPGIAMSARALHEQTDLLPFIEMHMLDAAPDAVGKNTRAAMQAGLYWGAVGAIRELIARQRDRLATPPQVFLTGGAAPSLASLLGGPDYTVRFVPHLVLSGIALAALHESACG
ncbi:MAG: type III pantothenate kinase [Pirellulales bacterium]